MSELLQPQVGQVYRHRKTGFLYSIMAVDFEAAGLLRHLCPTGNLFTYKCLDTGKTYARLVNEWEQEVLGFELTIDA